MGRLPRPQDADPDAMFVQQVFYGCVRYKKFLKVRGGGELPRPPAASLTGTRRHPRHAPPPSSAAVQR